MDEQSAKFEGWCVLELMGHRRLGGYVREQEIAGQGFLRIDVPAPTGSACTGCDYSVERCRAAQKAGAVACCPDCLHPDASAATQFYSPSAVYGITPVTEAMARAVAARNIPQPVARWELPAAPTPEAPKSCLNCGHDTPHTATGIGNNGDLVAVCGWERTDRPGAFACECPLLDLGDSECDSSVCDLCGESPCTDECADENPL